MEEEGNHNGNDHSMEMDTEEEDSKPAAKPTADTAGSYPNSSAVGLPADHYHNTDLTTTAASLPVDDDRCDNNIHEESTTSQLQEQERAELAFLVTHWLSGYDHHNQQRRLTAPEQPKYQEEEALRTIRRAAGELAAAFSTLGAFGTKPSTAALLQEEEERGAEEEDGPTAANNAAQQPLQQPITFADMKRTWGSSSSTHQLENLLSSAKSATAALETRLPKLQNHLLACQEIHSSSAAAANRSSSAKGGGRTLQDAIFIDGENGTEENNVQQTAGRGIVSSALLAPVVFLQQAVGIMGDATACTTSNGGIAVPQPETNVVVSATTDQNHHTGDGGSGSGDSMSLPVSSCIAEISATASHSMQEYLDLRGKCRKEEKEIQTMQRSLKYQQDTLQNLQLDRSRVSQQNHHQAGATSSGSDEVIMMDAMDVQLDEIKAAMDTCAGVIAHLEKKLPVLRKLHTARCVELVQTRQAAYRDFAHAKHVLQNYRDPVASRQRPAYSGNRLLFNLCNRQLGIDRSLGRSLPRSMGRIRVGDTTENYKALLYHRFSHAATINAHLSYEVYCLRFDRTGRYFISGSDDYLVKVFCVGGSIALPTRSHRSAGTVMNPASYSRGAVLVCTLKGHAGVITDVSVSADNAFLATASEDGDCRVWGLKDGCPVAILRGHRDGANMVSWSTLTPYRLVTTGADGLARTWDVREACLKRYGNLVGRRPEYVLRINGKEVLSDESIRNSEIAPAGAAAAAAAAAQPNDGEESTALSPLPPREVNGASNRENVILPPPLPPLPPAHAVGALPDPDNAIPPPPLPPLPPAADALGEANGNADDGEDNNDLEAGRFVANDMIDHGVKLVSKFQHGASVDERLVGPGTRSRRSAVNVLCVARCPYGGHFATGSNDGVCRVWSEESNSMVEKVDSQFCQTSPCPREGTRSSERHVEERLLCTLKGHLSAITDLHYSSKGDRILTASQKDGAVRVWSWAVDPAISARSSPMQSNSPGGAVRNHYHILIKLTKPESSVSATPRQRRRAGPNRSHSATISCDVAAWTSDDTKVVTSQSELIKQSGTEIVAGSQYIFLWDSSSGHCLLGIAGAHTRTCPVVLSHPIVPSIICSGGADGVVKLWDLESGQCVFQHKNIVDFGPTEPTERGKCVGYLDGEFSPDGSSLVLGDESGRVTVFDTRSRQPRPQGESDSWNRGFPNWMKEQYFSNDYYDLLYDLTGYCVEENSRHPPHLAPRGSRCTHSGAAYSTLVNDSFRGLTGPAPICERAARWQRKRIREIAAEMQVRKITTHGNRVRQFDPESTIVIQHGEVVVAPGRAADRVSPGTPRASSSQVATVSNSAQRLSSNWRWGDYDDLVRERGEDDGEHESDDEDFELNESRRVGRVSQERDNSDSEDLEADDEEQVVAEPSRVSARRQRQLQRHMAAELDGSEDEFTEYVSSNNTPTGPFVADYENHYFRMPSRNAADNVNRMWTRRNESTSSYEGRKKYTPQVGDSVIYIPRAHYDTIKQLPIVEAPWQNWPEESDWPVVRCSVRNIRYRFPYKNQSYRDACRSIVARLTLEITGIPELSSDRAFGWPSPSFTAPTKTHAFEVSLFENNETDFVVPEGLYTSRLRQLETALVEDETSVEVKTFYADEDEEEDAEFTAYSGRVLRYDDTEMDCYPHIAGSGFGSVVIQWSDSNPDNASPWEIAVSSSSHVPSIPRPQLEEDEKRRIRGGLHAIKGIKEVNNFFRLPVGENYWDYPTRVEVPMDLTFISDRLEADYYGSRFSVVADVRLIYTNSSKYNSEHDDLTELARQMLEKFEAHVLSEEERAVFHKYDTPIAGMHPLAAPLLPEIVPVETETTAVQRRSRRRRRPSPSALESLPAPNDADGVRSGLRSMGRTRASSRRSSHRQTRVRRERSVLEPALPAAHTLEQLSSRGGRSTRGRTARVGRRVAQSASTGQNNQDENARPSLRPGLRNSARQAAPPLLDDEQGVGYHSRRVGLRNSAPEDPLLGEFDRSNGNRSIVQVEEDSSHQSSRSSRHAAEEDGDSDQESHEEASEYRMDSSSGRQRRTRTTTSATTRNRSATRRAALSEDESSEPEASPSPPRRSTRNAAPSPTESPATRMTLRQRTMAAPASPAESNSESEEDDDEEPSPPTRSTRHSVAKDEESSFGEPQSENDASSTDDSNADHEMDSDVEEKPLASSTRTRSLRIRVSAARTTRDTVDDEVPKRRPKRKRNGRSERHESAFREQHDRGKAAAVSYLDPSSSEFDDDEPEEVVPAPVVRKKPKKKRRKSATAKSPSSRSNKEQKRKSHIEQTMEMHNISQWPEVPIPQITKVTEEMLSRLRSMDEFDSFSEPAVEKFPEIKKDYPKFVKFPMDFRTIAEERLPVYRSITDLQEDLILVFGNCMLFNGPDTPYYDAAQSMMLSVGDIFQAVCDELDVRTLRHHRS